MYVNPLFEKLSPLPGSEFAWYYFDDTHLVLQVPCDPRPKGSASPLPGVTKEGKPYIKWIAGSDSAGKAKGKMDEQERKIRLAIACLWKQGFVPYDEGCQLDLDCIFIAPKARISEEKHLIYPDRDKLLRSVQDMISPPIQNRKSIYEIPHLVRNDSQIYAGHTEKHWLHTWCKRTGLNDDSAGVYICLKP